MPELPRPGNIVLSLMGEERSRWVVPVTRVVNCAVVIMLVMMMVVMTTVVRLAMMRMAVVRRVVLLDPLGHVQNDWDASRETPDRV